MLRRQFQLRRAGFTLIEAIATMTILAALGSVASMLVMTSVDGFTRAATSAQLHSEMSVALDRIDRELRNITVDSSAPGIAPDISAITASSITWHTDYSLSLSGGNIMFVENGGTARVLLSDVTTFSVQAYDESNAALAASLSGSACEPVRRLRITITLQRSGVTQTLRTRIFLRCTMANAGGGG
jgi:prepilin-type N-terminal cleavage/methylation domain-containing protein